MHTSSPRRGGVLRLPVGLVLASSLVRCASLVGASDLHVVAADGAIVEELRDATIPEVRADAAEDAVDADAGDAGALFDASVWAGNGHRYAVMVRSSGITWIEAKGEAESLGGHLVTVTSAAENDFVFTLIRSLDGVWVKDFGPWIGAFRESDGGATAPDAAGGTDAGWAWVTGEPWSYSAWEEGEPNNSGGAEDVASYNSETRPRTFGLWNDRGSNLTHPAYVLELE